MPYSISQTHDNLHIAEQEYAYGDTIQFTNMTSCLAIVGKVQVEGATQLLGVHLVQVGPSGPFDQDAADQVAQLFEGGSDLALIGYETWEGEGAEPLSELIGELREINEGPLDAEYTNGEGGFKNGKPYKASLEGGSIEISRELTKQEEAAQAAQEAKEAAQQEKQAEEMLEATEAELQQVKEEQAKNPTEEGAKKQEELEGEVEDQKELLAETKQRKETKAKEAIEKSQQAQQENLESTLRAQAEQVAMVDQYQNSPELQAISTDIGNSEDMLKSSTPDNLSDILKTVNENINQTIKPALNTQIETASQEAAKAENEAWQESMKTAQENIDTFEKEYTESNTEIEEMKELEE